VTRYRAKEKSRLLPVPGSDGSLEISPTTEITQADRPNAG
jgi:hypothetical protein